MASLSNIYKALLNYRNLAKLGYDRPTLKNRFNAYDKYTPTWSSENKPDWFPPENWKGYVTWPEHAPIEYKPTHSGPYMPGIPYPKWPGTRNDDGSRVNHEGINTIYLAALLSRTTDNPNIYSSSFGDHFGVSVDISTNYLVVGASYEGTVYIFSTSTGELIQTLRGPSSEYFGNAVAISKNEDYLVIGANQKYIGANGVGAIYVYNTSDWSLRYGKDCPSPSSGAGFGTRIAANTTHTIVGSSGHNSGSGRAYVFNIATGQLVYTLDNPNTNTSSSDDRFGIDVAIASSHMLVGAQQEDDANSNSGKAYIYNLSNGQLLHTLDNPSTYGTTANDYFGAVVNMSDAYSAVVGYYEDDASGFDSGKVYIFDNTTGNLVRTLDNPNTYDTSSMDRFGENVCITDSYVAVGASLEDTASNYSTGVIYVFSTSTWNLIQTISNPNDYGSADNDQFGKKIRANGDTIIVGVEDEDDLMGETSGKAYTFNALTGALGHTLDNPNAYGGSGGDNFGSSVDISASYTLAGAYAEVSPGGYSNAGVAYLFNNSTGELVHSFENPNVYGTPAHDYYAGQVCVSESYTLLGAYQEDSASASNTGVAYLFSNSTGQVLHTFNNPNAQGTAANDYFGSKLALNENYAIVGTTSEVHAEGSSSGIVYIFSTSTGQLLHTIENPDAYGTAASDYFSSFIAITDSYLLVGAPYEDEASGDGSGKAYIFSTSGWGLLHTLDNPNDYGTVTNDYFGTTGAICASYSAVTALEEDSEGHNKTGRVYVFDNTTGNLVHTLNNPSSYGTPAGDNFGVSVAISEDYIVVGADYEDDEGIYSSGAAYVFKTTDGSLVATIENPNSSGNDYFGQSVAIYGNKVVVGVRGEADTLGTTSGKVYTYTIGPS